MDKRKRTSDRRQALSRKRFLQGSLLVPLSYFFAEGFSEGLQAEGNSDPHRSFASSQELYLNQIRSHKHPILQALQAGMAAPSPHNVQPWIFEILDENTADLFLDPTRLLPHTDPPGRQVMIGQGTFLEMMQIGATTAGLRVTETLFPRGENEDLIAGNRPIARIKAVFDSSVKQDPLAASIPKRITDRSSYDNRPLSSSAQSALIKEARGFHASLKIIQDAETMQKIRYLATRGMRIESDNYVTNEESRIWFRMSDEEIYHYRDGISLRGNGLSGIRLFVARNFFISTEPESFHAQSNRDAGVQLMEDAMNSTATCLSLTTKTNTRKDQVLAGKDYVRLQLQATMQGLHLQPLSQILQEYEQMNAPRIEFEKLSGTTEHGKVQMLLRIGHGTEEFHSPRRYLNHLLKGKKLS